MSTVNEYAVSESNENSYSISECRHERVQSSLLEKGTDDNTNKIPSKRKRPLKPRWLEHMVYRQWLWESSACIFSSACMAAVVGVLIGVNGRPVEQWRFEITPNAVVSFIATLAKSSFIMVVAQVIGQLKWLHYNDNAESLIDFEYFDEASRGPWGSVQLLAKKNKRTLLASTAAFVTILALFMDPLVQLVIVFRSRPVPLISLRPVQGDEAGFFAVATRYNPRNLPISDGTEANSWDPIDSNMQNAILGGIFNRSLSLHVPCSTGNCTWHDQNLTTLAVCGNCSDVTRETEVDCTLKGPPRADFSKCAYRFPNGLETEAWVKRPWVMDIEAVQYTTQTKWNSTVGHLPLYENESELVEGPATIANFSVIQVHDYTDNGRIPPVHAVSCRLDFCKKTFRDVRIDRGVFDTSAIIETFLMAKGPLEREITNNSGRSGALSLHFADSSEEAEFEASIDLRDYSDLMRYLVYIFSFARTNSGEDEFRGKIEPSLLTNNTSSRFGVSPTPGISAQLANSTDLDAVMKALAASMTESVRMRGGANVTGIPMTQTTLIEVRWGILAYPLALLFSSIVMLAIVIRRTRNRQGVSAWKNSGLVLLFHDIEGIQRKHDSGVTLPDLNSLAKTLKGQSTFHNGKLVIITEEHQTFRDIRRRTGIGGESH